LGCACIFLLGQGEFIGNQFSKPQHFNTVRIDYQQHIAYDYYQQSSINTLYLYDRSNNRYGIIKADINLDNQVDVVLTKNLLGTYDWEVYTYGHKQRIIFYILAGLSLLAIRGMQRKRKKELHANSHITPEMIFTASAPIVL